MKKKKEPCTCEPHEYGRYCRHGKWVKGHYALRGYKKKKA